MGGCAKIVVPISADALSVQMLMEGIRQIGLAVREIREFQTEKAARHQVNFTFVNEKGLEIGVVAKEGAEQVEFLVNGSDDDKKKAAETINRVRQVYSKIKVMNDLKKKGYKNVKEEKLADGSIRLVLQKMAVKKEVVVTINELGEVSLEYVNHKGSECKEELGPVESALGKAKERRWEKEHGAPSKKPLEQKKKIGTKTG